MHVLFFFFRVVLSYVRQKTHHPHDYHDFTEAPFGGHGHADAGGYTLPQWTRGHLHATRLAKLGVARAARTQPGTKAVTYCTYQLTNIL